MPVRDGGERGVGRMTLVPSVSVGRVATQLGVSPTTIRNWIAKGYVHAIRLPSGVRRVPEAEVHRLMAEVFGGEMAEGDAPRIRVGPQTTEEDPFPAV
jgi:excisionase family DNA binding protein